MPEEKGQLCEPSIPNSWFEERSGTQSIGSNNGRGVLAMMTSGMIAALAAIAGSKITALVLGWVEGWVVRSDSRGFGAVGAFWPCAFASIVW